MSTWPTFEQQQRICQRRDTVTCIALGAPGCELCTPCRYTDLELTARRLPIDEIRARHARDVAEMPLMCTGCFTDRPREERDSLVTDHLVGLYGDKAPGVLEGLRREIGAIVADFTDEQLLKARDWSSYEWRNWMDTNLPPLETAAD